MASNSCTEALDLSDAYGHWGEHPDYPVSDWQVEVANDETRLGYWYWVEGQLNNVDEEEPWTETERAAYNGLSSADYRNPL